MVDQKGYFDLLDWLESQGRIVPQQFFERMCASFGITHLAYVDAAITPAGVRRHSVFHTLTPLLMQSFASLGSDILTPVLRTALTAIRPLDWATLSRTHACFRAVTAHARQLGLPQKGVCYPLVSHRGRSAFLAVNVDASARQWQQFRRLYDRDINALAMQFHAAMIDGAGTNIGTGTGIGAGQPASRPAPRLTGREREALRWAAAGKSYWEIATILGISERTVRFFMANARRKLNVVSNAQAVAEALWHGIIPHP